MKRHRTHLFLCLDVMTLMCHSIYVHLSCVFNALSLVSTQPYPDFVYTGLCGKPWPMLLCSAKGGLPACYRRDLPSDFFFFFFFFVWVFPSNQVRPAFKKAERQTSLGMFFKFVVGQNSSTHFTATWERVAANNYLSGWSQKEPPDRLISLLIWSACVRRAMENCLQSLKLLK